MEYCRTKRVLLQAWSPLAQGILTGNLDGEPEKIRKTSALVQECARRHETTAEAILLAWLPNTRRRSSPFWELRARLDCGLVLRHFPFP